MAPAVEYEIQACLDTYTKHERKQHDYCATEYQSLVNEDGTKSELHYYGIQGSHTLPYTHITQGIIHPPFL